MAHTPISPQLPNTLREAFQSMHPSLQSTCRTVTFPPEEGFNLLLSIQGANNNIFAASDASFKTDKAAHAWILSNGKVTNIMDPLLNLHGYGHVHGPSQSLSSTWGELQGITAITIMSKVVSDLIGTPCKITAVCDNTGAIQKCSNGRFTSLRNHRRPTIDLYFTQHRQSTPNHLSLSWVKGHTDKQPWSTVIDLQSQHLSRDKIYNVWCDRMAGEAWNSSFSPQDAPDVYIDEHWAVYSLFPHYHKITGELSQNLFWTLGFTSFQTYIRQKHNITPVKLQHVNLDALQWYLSTLKESKRATTSKLIHNWIPTYSILCRQGRAPSTLCPRCLASIETSCHVWQCPLLSVVTPCAEHLHHFLKLYCPWIQLSIFYQYSSINFL